MGTHPTAPSRVASSNQKLSEYLAAHPELLGNSVVDRFDAANGNLPFLFKVLSIEKALSIQTHPDKETAGKLHADRPDIYKGATLVYTVPSDHSDRMLKIPTTSPRWRWLSLRSPGCVDLSHWSRSPCIFRLHRNSLLSSRQ